MHVSWIKVLATATEQADFPNRWNSKPTFSNFEAKGKMCFVLISFPLFFFGSSRKKKKENQKQYFSSCINRLSPRYEITALCCQKPNTSVCCLPCQNSPQKSVCWFLSKHDGIFATIRHIQWPNLLLSVCLAAFGRGPTSIVPAPAPWAGSSSCSVAAGPRHGRRAAPVRQEPKAVWSPSVSAESSNKVRRVSAGKPRHAKLLTETHCPPWQQVGL